MDVIKFFLSLGMAITKEAVKGAIWFDKVEAAKYLLENGGTVESKSVVTNAIEASNVSDQMIKLLVEHGAPISDHLVERIASLSKDESVESYSEINNMGESSPYNAE
jgi:hypothetical protein